jgi:hypothetical protein
LIFTPKPVRCAAAAAKRARGARAAPDGRSRLEGRLHAEPIVSAPPHRAARSFLAAAPLDARKTRLPTAHARRYAITCTPAAARLTPATSFLFVVVCRRVPFAQRHVALHLGAPLRRGAQRAASADEVRAHPPRSARKLHIAPAAGLLPV